MATNFGIRLRFKDRNNTRSWVETWIYQSEANGPSDPVFRADLTRIAGKRANALVSTNRIVDATVYVFNTPNETVIIGLNLPGQVSTGGAAAAQQDVAPVARLLQLSLSSGRKRQYLMRGVNDADVVGGLWQPSSTRGPMYDVWTDAILAEPLRGTSTVFEAAIPIDRVGRDPVEPNKYLITTPVAAPWVKDDVIDVVTRVEGGGRRVQTRVRVLRAAAGIAFYLNGWVHGTCTGGEGRRTALNVLPYVAIAAREEVRTRKTGGPFTRFRGRR